MLIAAAVAAAAAAVGMTSFGASRAGAAPAAQPSPVVDPDYLYQQLYSMATSYSYRVSGADGPPQAPKNPFNVPPTVNGWQELFAYWKGQLTNTQTNGALAAFATPSDHYFRRSGGYRFDSDDAEVTIPGATCPGQRVMLASHPDEAPVPTDIVDEINSGSPNGVNGFGAARREITDSNLGNEGAYDGLSGVAVTMAEYHALLQWYEANKTYPKRTLKVTLLDASRGKTGDGLFTREGSKYYADNLLPAGPQGKVVLFANMDSLGFDYPAFHLGTKFFWNDISGGTVPPWMTFIKATPDAPNKAYPDTGAGSPGAAIAANAAAIGQLHSNLQSAVSAGFAQQGAKYAFSSPAENPLRYDKLGQAPNPYSGSAPLLPAYSAADQQRFSPVRDDTDALEDEQAFFDKGVPGFTVSGVKNSNSDENPYAASVSDSVKATPIISYAGNQTTFQIGDNAPVGGMTTLADPAAAGDTTVTVTSAADLGKGDPVFVDNGANIEYDQIQSIGTADADGKSPVTLAHPLTAAHASGVPFNVNEGQPVGFTGDSIEHLNFFAGGAPHGVDGPGQPTEELKRALELPAQWTSLLLAGDDYAGSTAMPTTPVAYFETSPVNPASTTTVSFDASFARAADGSTKGLTYFWDFGDGKTATGKTVSHTFAGPTYADVKLAVGKRGSWGLYRQAVPVDSPSGAAPSTPACGTFSSDEAKSLIAAASGGDSPAKSEEVSR